MTVKIVVEVDDRTPMYKVNMILDSIRAIAEIEKIKIEDAYFETKKEG